MHYMFHLIFFLCFYLFNFKSDFRFEFKSESINIMSENLLKSSFRYKEEDPDYRGDPLD